MLVHFHTGAPGQVPLLQVQVKVKVHNIKVQVKVHKIKVQVKVHNVLYGDT